MNVNEIDVRPRDYGFGKLRYTERLFADVPYKAEAFLGRMIGLYAYTTEFHTDIETLEDLHKRANIFRTINIWVDNSPKMVRNAHSRICGDFPGIGKDDVLDINLDLVKVEKWADYEGDALAACSSLRKFYKEVWDGDFVQMGMDLHFNIKSLNLIRQWMEIPSWEVRYITDKVTAQMAKEGMLQKYVDGEDITGYRERLARAWEEQEKILLSVPTSKRKEENFV